MPADKSRDLDYIERISEYCGQVAQSLSEIDDSYAVFMERVTYQNAVAMCILQIGELAKNLSPEFIADHKEIPKQAADIDTMSVSSFLPEKSLFTGLFGLFHFRRRFKVRAHLHNFRFRMVAFVCTLKRERLGVQKRVHSETEHFRVRSILKKAEVHFLLLGKN